MSRFKFVPLLMGSGWISGHVAVDEYHRWPNKEGGQEIFLNVDTQDFEEFSEEIDKLIAELEEVRDIARRKFRNK